MVEFNLNLHLFFAHNQVPFSYTVTVMSRGKLVPMDACLNITCDFGPHGRYPGYIIGIQAATLPSACMPLGVGIPSNGSSYKHFKEALQWE